MLVVSVVSLKGGVGKTTTVLGLAAAAARRGLATLVVDLDPQANATAVLAPPTVPATSADVLRRGRPGAAAEAVAASAWRESGAGPVDVVAADAALVSATGDALRLRLSMRPLPGYDLALVDCPPSLGTLTSNALAASALALVVTEPSLFALRATSRAIDAVEQVRASFNLRLRAAGIVVNRVRAGSADHAFRLAELSTAFPDLVLHPPVPERSAVQQAQGAGVPLHRWPTPGAREAAGVFAGYLDVLLATADHPGQDLFTPGLGRRR